ncbi:hypothetical protein BKA62DRAFT_832952 [Auriculariales sp. MPI-PUGE-AT-0066]|nr:hypothetical protein BKA62DRAFT_832952 [Auriculariales sp. MPI-PUGE-AT-0066]
MDTSGRLLRFKVDQKPGLHLRQLPPATRTSASSSASSSTGSDTVSSGLSSGPPERSSSSAFEPFFTQGSSPSSTPDGSNPSAASLYLFVFLATLLLLLGLSVGILLRSFVLRRRFRRRVEEALAAGVHFGPRMDVGGPPLLGRWKRPILHDVALDDPEKERLSTGQTADGWENVQPLCAMVMSPDPSCHGYDTPQYQHSQPQPQRNTPTINLIRHFWTNGLGFRDDVPPGIGGSTPTQAFALRSQGSGSHSRPSMSTSRADAASLSALWQPQLDHTANGNLHLSLPATPTASSVRRRQGRERQVDPSVMHTAGEKNDAAATKDDVDIEKGISQGGVVRVAIIVAMPSQWYSYNTAGLQGLAIELGVLEENVDGLVRRDNRETESTAG